MSKPNALTNRDNDGYDQFSEEIRNHFGFFTTLPKVQLFTTNVEGLFDLYLNGLDESGRQHYNCHACKNFLDRYGGLVMIDDDGKTQSALWDYEAVPDFFKKSVRAMKLAVEKAPVNGVFISKEATLGTPVLGEWNHMHVVLPNKMLLRSSVKTPYQVMAEKHEDFKMLISALLEYSLETVDKALTLIHSESLYRSDNVQGVAEWFKKLKLEWARANGTNRNNIVWLYVANAPAGWCHIKSSMIGTLLDDISSGLSSNIVAARFAEKMNPGNYMRSQVAPTQSNINQAEKIVEKLGIADSLKRKYAQLDQIPEFLWTPKQFIMPEKKTGNVFANVAPKEKVAKSQSNFELPATTMTWEKFSRTILPYAESMEVKTDNPNRFMALITASVQDAPNILQWNNTFSWYYHGGVDAEMKRRVEESGGRYENNEIRCSLMWEGPTDLDLHCVTPSGFHIYYRQKRDLSGGYLDVDANGGHVTSYTPVENIRWTNNAPQGNYRFYVHNFTERGSGFTPFKMELEIFGKVYTFNETALGTEWTLNVFEFNYQRGKPVSMKLSNSYTSENSWNVPVNDFVKVNAITVSPNLWGKNPIDHAGSHVFFILDGCKDLSEGKGRGFFNEMLKSDLREVRKTLEAYTANTAIEGVDQANACGLGYSKDTQWNLLVRVVSNNSTQLIKIDRWD